MVLAHLFFGALLLAADGPSAKPEPPMPPDEAAVVAKPEPPMPPDEAEVIARELAAAKKKKEAEERARNDLQLQRRLLANGMRNNGWILPTKAPIAGRRERFLFLPQAPLVTEVSMTIDGQPYWTYREGMIEKLLTGDPKVDGGRVAWLAILKNPRTSNGRYASFQANESYLKQQAQQFDANGDGFADREEAQLFLAQSYSGPALSVMNYPVQQMAIPVSKVLDTNDDGKLSAAELDAAPARLASRDADDNELLESTELTGFNPYAPQVRVQAQTPQVPLIVSIDDGFDPQPVLRLIVSRYGKDGKVPPDAFARLPGFFASLDANSDGELGASELSALERCPPHLVLEVNLGRTGSLPTGMVVRQVSPQLKAKIPGESGERVALEMPGMKVQLIGASPQLNFNYDTQAQALLTQLDTDKNGYIEKKELEGQQLQGYLQQFVQWDANDDGKVYLDELKGYFERFQAPMLHSISVGSAELGNSLWEAMDSNGDGQLSVRERSQAPARLKSLDADGDGQIAANEIMPTIRLAIARGQYAYQYLASQQYGGYRPPNQAGAAPPGPAWFHRMDRNSDGDVTRREFLGSEEQFRSLDANNDGILEVKEVEGK